MANSQLFNTTQDKANTVNMAGGKAYQRSDKAALAQYAATCMFGNTYYADGKAQLDEILEIAKRVPTDFLAKVAVYSRQNAYLKDMPALLLAVLSTRDLDLFKEVFFEVVDNARMLRNFVQIMRSGVVGRTSLGSAPKKLVQQWLTQATDEYLFKASVGNNPSLADLIRMVHPRPRHSRRANLYRYIIGKDYDEAELPDLVKQFEVFKREDPATRVVPDVPFQMLTSLTLSEEEWKEIARNGAWQFTRMNLNTFKRHGVFDDDNMVELIANRLRDEKLIKRARQYPYQVYSAYRAAGADMPATIQTALHDAVNVCAGNVPEFEGKTAVLVDVSGSMTWAGPGKSSNIKCSDVAALFAAIVVKRNPDARVYAFDYGTTRVRMTPMDSVFTNAERLAKYGGGGTNMSAAMERLIKDKFYADNVIIISDNESWMGGGWYGSRTGTMNEFGKLLKHNPKARLVLMDLTPSTTSQVKDKTNVLNVGGFSDAVFDVIAGFIQGSGKPDYWADQIEKTVSI